MKMKWKLICAGLALAVVQTAKADSYTQSFNGSTFTGAPNGNGELFGNVTVHTDELPPMGQRATVFTDAFSGSMTWIEPDSETIRMQLAAVGIGCCGQHYGTYLPGTDPTDYCSIVSSQGAPAGCSLDFVWSYKDDPSYMSIETFGRSFLDSPPLSGCSPTEAQGCGLWTNYDNSEGPDHNAAFFRGNWVLTPEPPTWMFSFIGVLGLAVLVVLKKR